MPFDDTIFAVSSAGGTAGGGLRAIVRITGSDAWRLANEVLTSPPTAGKAGVSFQMLRPVRLPAMVVRFKGPRSYTGEDVTELHVAGSGSLLRQLERLLREAGGRHAEPGEFSARAFFNGKIDLTEAEGIAATIGATNRLQLRAAAALRDGALHRWTGGMAEQLAETLALLEAGIDFTDEEGVSFLSAEACAERLGRMMREMEALMRAAVRWERVDSMPTVVLTGEPNVGKSSLLNALTGGKRAIVSAVAGTTRDALAATMQTPRGVVRVVDVAGIESAGESLRDAMNESRGRVLREADLVLLVTDGVLDETALQPARTELDDVGAEEVMVVRNKCDVGGTPGFETEVSALTGVGIEALRCEIGERLGRQAWQGESAMTLNGRHREALWRAMRGLREAVQMCGSGDFSRQLELVAAEIRAALNEVGSISGNVTADEVLGRIFSRFCIGK